jgi:hypothetical protein
MLQAALDLSNDPVLITTGVNKHTINVATTLTILGVPMDKVIKFLNEPQIRGLVKTLEEKEGSYGSGPDLFVSDFVKKHLTKITEDMAPKTGLTNDALQRAFANNGVSAPSSKIKEGINQTKDGVLFRAVKKEMIKEGVFTYTLSEVTPGEIEGSKDFEVINKFVEISKISDDIKLLIPILQLDNKLPNTFDDLVSLQDTFKVLNNESEKVLKFTTDNVMNRPLVKHYKEVVTLLNDTMEKHFYTSEPMFVANARIMADNLYEKATPFQKKSVLKTMTKATQMLWAQKRLMKDVIYRDPQESMNVLATKIKQIQFADEGNEITLPKSIDPDGVISNELNSGKSDSREYLRNDWKEDGKDLEVLENAFKMYDEILEMQPLKDALKDNKALAYLQVKEKNGNYVINGKSAIGKLNETAKIEVKKDFAKIKEIDKGLYQALLHQQLMRFGMESKRNSYADILPDIEFVTYMRALSTAKAFANPLTEMKGGKEVPVMTIDKKTGKEKMKDPGTIQKNAKVTRVNTALEMKDKLPNLDRQLYPKVEVNEVIEKGVRYQVVKMASDFFVKDDTVYMKVEGKKNNQGKDFFIPVEEHGIYKNENYTQFAKNDLQVKSRSELSEEEQEELNKCFI